MKKTELLKKLDTLLKEKGMDKIETFSGKIGQSNNKATIESAIKCLETPDDVMGDYLTVFRLKYPSSYTAIMQAGNWITHSHNRYYVYCTARQILAD